MKTKQMDQSKLSAECWLVQFWGTEKCKDCEFKGKRSCGGKNILKTGKNALGYSVTATGIE